MRATWPAELTAKVLVLQILMSMLSDITVTSTLQKTDADTVQKLSVEAALALRHERILRQQRFKRTKEEVLKGISRNVIPGKVILEGNFTSVIMEHDGEPLPLYIILIALMPLIISELFRILWDLIRPKLKFQIEGGGEFPFTACCHLQETLREQSLKRPARNCTSWFVHQYILSIEDKTLEWKDVLDSLQVPQAVRKKKPWHTIRLIFRMRNALKREQLQFEEEEIVSQANLLAGPTASAANLQSHPTVDTLQLENQISHLELHYETLNALEKDYEVPSPPLPQLFTVRELMKFMTMDEKLLVLRCFDKTQMNKLMINCDIEDIRRRNEDFFQAHMEAGATVYDHVGKLNSKSSTAKKGAKPPTTVGNVEEKEKSIQTLFDIKDKLAKEIVKSNDLLLEDWENNEKQNEISSELELEPLHIKSHKLDYDMEPEDILDEFFIQEQPEELKVKPVTSEEIIEQLIKKAALDIDYIEERKNLKKKRKKGKSKITANVNTKKKDILADGEKGEGETDDKVPFNWQRKSDDKDEIAEMLEDLPKLKHHDQKKGKHHKKLHKLKNQDNSGGSNLPERKNIKNEHKETEKQRSPEDENEGIKHVNATGDKGRRNAENEAKEQYPKIPEHEAKEKLKISENKSKNKEKRKIPESENESKGKEQRKISGSENESKDKEQRKISGSENESKDKEKRKISESENESKDKERRKISGGESGEKPYRKLSGNEHEKRKTSGEDTKEKKKSRISGDEPSHEHRQLSKDESEEKGHQSISNEEQPRTSERKRSKSDKPENEDGDRGRRKLSEDERKERERQKSNQNKRRESEQRRISENERIENEKRKFSENDQEKEGGKYIPENDAKGNSTRKSSDKGDQKMSKISETEENDLNTIGIQTHHHHHQTQNMPKLMLDQQENSPGNFVIGDDAVLQYSQNKDVTKSKVMAIEKDTLFKESKDHPQIKIYSQGRRTHFDELLHELMKPNKDSDKSPGNS